MTKMRLPGFRSLPTVLLVVGCFLLSTAVARAQTPVVGVSLGYYHVGGDRVFHSPNGGGFEVSAGPEWGFGLEVRGGVTGNYREGLRGVCIPEADCDTGVRFDQLQYFLQPAFAVPLDSRSAWELYVGGRFGGALSQMTHGRSGVVWGSTAGIRRRLGRAVRGTVSFLFTKSSFPEEEVRGINPPAFTQHRIGLRVGLELIGR